MLHLFRSCIEAVVGPPWTYRKPDLDGELGVRFKAVSDEHPDERIEPIIAVAVMREYLDQFAGYAFLARSMNPEISRDNMAMAVRERTGEITQNAAEWLSQHSIMSTGEAKTLLVTLMLKQENKYGTTDKQVRGENMLVTSDKEMDRLIQMAIETGGLDYALADIEIRLGCPSYLGRFPEDSSIINELNHLPEFLRRLRDGWRPSWSEVPSWSSAYNYEGTYRHHVSRSCAAAKMVGRDLGHKPTYAETKKYILDRYPVCPNCPHDTE